MKPDTAKTDFLSTLPGILTAAVAANLLWGSAAPCIKLGYQYFAIAGEDTLSQILFAGVRFTLAGALTILIGSLLRRRLLLPKRGSGGMILTLAMMQTVIQYTFFYIGLSHAPGFKGSIISPTSTFFALLIAALVFRQEKLTAKKLLGCLIGFAGVIVVSVNGSVEPSGSPRRICLQIDPIERRTPTSSGVCCSEPKSGSSSRLQVSAQDVTLISPSSWKCRRIDSIRSAIRSSFSSRSLRETTVS